VAGGELDDLAAFVDKSLVRRTGDGRFFMLETIREFAREHLGDSGEADDVTRRHVDYFSELVERLDPELRAHGQDVALETLDRDHDNVRAAIDYAAATGLDAAEAQLAGAAWYFWYLRGHLVEGVARLERALRHEGIDTSSRARLHEGLAALETLHGNHEAARRHADISLHMRGDLGDPEGLLRALTNRANVASHEGDVELEEALQAECAELALKTVNAWFRGLALGNLAWAAVERGDYERAVATGTEAVGLLEELGDRQGGAGCSIILAHAELGCGRRHDGISRLVRFLEQDEAVRIPESTLWCLELLAAALTEDAPERSARLYGAAAAIATDVGFSLSPTCHRLRAQASAELEECLGQVALAEAEAEGARMSIEEAVRYALASVPGHR
jgi:tetratricopeptide (TPR) repeat protein